MDPPRSERQPAALALAAVVRRVRALPMFVVLSFTGVLVVIGLVGRLAFEFAQGMRDPHRHMFGQDGVRPLLGKDRVFDVGVSIFALRPFNETARPECSTEAESDWYEHFFDRVYGRHRERPGEDATDSDEDMTDSDRLYHAIARESLNRGHAWNLPPTPCAMRYVPETAELWSGVVARNLTIANRTAEATIDLDVPTEFLKPLRNESNDPKWRYRSRGPLPEPDVYAVVTLIPHLEDLRWTEWFKGGVHDVPLLGSSLLEQLEDRISVVAEEDRERPDRNETAAGTAADARRVLLESLSVRAPLVVTRYHQRRAYLANELKAVLLKRTSLVSPYDFSALHGQLMMMGCSAPRVPPHRVLCRKRSYADMGHWYAQYALDKPVWRPKNFDGPDNGNPYAEEEWERRRYPPYFDVLKPGPLDYNNVSVDDAAPLRHSIQFRLSVIDEVRLGVLEAKREPSGPGEFDPHTQREQDRTRRLHALLGIGPRWGPALDEVLRLLAGGARMAASALTVLYWATRRTTTGLSVTGLAFLVAGEILRHVAGTWDYYHSTLRGGVFWVVIWPILFLPELLQLRLLLPYSVEREDFAGRPPAWRVARLPATARERRSARLGPDWRQVGALAGVLACAAFALLAHPVRLLPGSHDGSHAETYDALYPGSRAYNKWWAYLGYEWQHEMPLAHRLLRKIWLLPLAQSLVSAGQVAQLVLNYRARTFAGNYALACALKAVALVSLAAPFIAGSALNDGLYLSAAVQAALVLAETWQAWTYPRVEQETDGEEMEM